MEHGLGPLRARFVARQVEQPLSVSRSLRCPSIVVIYISIYLHTPGENAFRRRAAVRHLLRDLREISIPRVVIFLCDAKKYENAKLDDRGFRAEGLLGLF